MVVVWCPEGALVCVFPRAGGVCVGVYKCMRPSATTLDDAAYSDVMARRRERDPYSNTPDSYCFARMGLVLCNLTRQPATAIQHGIHSCFASNGLVCSLS
jgi:hypothetical protein